MADTVTPVMGLTKPEVGASRDTWGNKLNANFDLIDPLKTQIDAKAPAAIADIASYVTKATIVDADNLAGFDSAASNAKSKWTWAVLKATLLTYFNTLYAPLISPPLTGVPTAPTAAALTSTTQIATTAFATAADATAGGVNASAEKLTAADGDYFAGWDSAAGYGKSRWSITTLKTALAGSPVLMTPVTASGAVVDFAGIPATAKRITINYAGLSSSSSSQLMVQLGDSGGIEATGYLGTGIFLKRYDTADSANLTTGISLEGSFSTTPSAVRHGSMVLTLTDPATNTWVGSAVGARSDTNAIIIGSGSKALSAALDRVRITSVGGTDTFDAGKISVIYE